MLKTIIADDEDKVCQLIKILIEWEKNDMVLQGVANNGNDTFSLIVQQKPDIVITDIRMPGLDGLEIIRKTRELQYDTHFIVISGYRQFEYARQALKYGVEDYLLKPIIKKDLNAVLQKISGKINRIQYQEQIKITAQKDLHKSKKLLHNEFMQKLQKNMITLSDSREICKEYDLRFESPYFCGIALRIDYDYSENRIKDQERFLTDRLGEMLEEQFGPPVISEAIVDAGSLNSIVCFLNFTDMEVVQEQLNTVFSKMQVYIYAFGSCKITIGVGKTVIGLKSAYDSIESSLQALQYRLFLGNDRIIYFSKYTFSSEETAEQKLNGKKADIRMAVENFSTRKLVSVLSSLFGNLLPNKEENPSIYYRLAKSVTEYFFICLQVEGTEDFYSEKEEILEQIPLAYTLDIMYRLLTKNLCCILSDYKERLKSDQERPVREAERYIKDHFAEKITLENIASQVNKNPVYFSTVFKNKTGQNFSDYLVQTRLEAAKNLLRESYESISFIAEKVGYKDTRYFSQIFTKFIGIKPSVYRKLYS